MLRSLTVAIALATLMPTVASMQDLPAHQTISVEASQSTRQATIPLPNVSIQTPPPATPRAVQGPPPPTPPPPPAAAQPPRKPRGRDTNVQIELTISDQLANAAPDKRVVSMLIADGVFGRIRSGDNPNIAMLNVDARPEILDNDRLVIEITIEYRPLPPDGTVPAKRPAPLNEQLTVILQNAKPMLVSQAADPVVDRKMTVEVRATILK
jgi:hypothetical protein